MAQAMDLRLGFLNKFIHFKYSIVNNKDYLKFSSYSVKN